MERPGNRGLRDMLMRGTGLGDRRPWDRQPGVTLSPFGWTELSATECAGMGPCGCGHGWCGGTDSLEGGKVPLER